METLKSGDVPSLVTNVEVMRILSDRIEARRRAEEDDGAPAAVRRRRRQDGEMRHRDWIEEAVHEYLRATPCADVEYGRMPELVAKLKGRKKPAAGRDGKRAQGTDVAMADAEGGNDHSGEDGGENVAGRSQDEGFGLTDGETLQVLNLMPRESVEIHLLIEDLPSRMTEERQGELLELVGKYAGTDEGGGDEEFADEDGEEEGEEIVGEIEEEATKGAENGYR